MRSASRRSSATAKSVGPLPERASAMPRSDARERASAMAGQRRSAGPSRSFRALSRRSCGVTLPRANASRTTSTDAAAPRSAVLSSVKTSFVASRARDRTTTTCVGTGSGSGSTRSPRPPTNAHARTGREERHVRSDRGREGDKIDIAAFPDRRERTQHRARVARTAAEARGHGHALADVHECRRFATCRRRHRAHGAAREILTGRSAHIRRDADLKTTVWGDAHAVSEVDRREHAAKLVVAIVPLSGDREREVDLRGREQRDLAAGHGRADEGSVATPRARASATHSVSVSSSARRLGSMPQARSAASARSGVTPAS